METVSPKLETLKTRQCSPEEIQAALVQLIELHNELVGKINEMISSGRIKSSSDARTDVMNMPYDL